MDSGLHHTNIVEANNIHSCSNIDHETVVILTKLELVGATNKRQYKNYWERILITLIMMTH